MPFEIRYRKWTYGRHKGEYYEETVFKCPACEFETPFSGKGEIHLMEHIWKLLVGKKGGKQPTP